VIDELLAWLRETSGPLPYLALGAAAAVEYLVPPLPGDTVTLFGAFLCTTAGRSPLLVYGAINAGAVTGAMTAYGVGRALRSHPGWLTRPTLRRALDDATRRFERHGSVYLVVNRFIPALRGVFFVAAGTAGLPAWKVLLFGGVSALLWNALLVLVASAIGDNWARLQEVFQRYTVAALSLVAVVVAVAAWRWWRSSPAAEPAPGPERPPAGPAPGAADRP
jgi:membrane protein DedA with SNARE-associated domain